LSSIIIGPKSDCGKIKSSLYYFFKLMTTLPVDPPILPKYVHTNIRNKN